MIETLKTRGVLLLIRRLAARVGAPGGETSVRGLCIVGRLAARCAPPGGNEKTVGLGGAGAWRWAGTARRSGPVSPGGDAVVLCFPVSCLTDNDALLGSGDAVP